jgi:hypothetical protein
MCFPENYLSLLSGYCRFLEAGASVLFVRRPIYLHIAMFALSMQQRRAHFYTDCHEWCAAYRG